MAETTGEMDIIKHLLEIEKTASEMIDEAQIEADRRLSEARAKYNAEYKEKYDVVIADLEKEYNKSVKDLENQHTEIINQYKESLESKEKNIDAFNSLLDTCFFENK